MELYNPCTTHSTIEPIGQKTRMDYAKTGGALS